MNIHEYQAKALFEKFGVPVPKGAAATSLESCKKTGEFVRGDHSAHRGVPAEPCLKEQRW